MISEWRVKSFKSARREARIRLPGITILVGANSSGKSAILQSILLVAQSIGDRVTGRQVVVNGRWTKLGDFDEIHSSKATDPITIGMTLDVELLLRITSSSRHVSGASHLLFHAKGVKRLDYSVSIDKGKEEGVKGLLLPKITECRFRVDGAEDRLSELHVVASATPAEERLEKLLSKAPDASEYRNMSAALEYEVRKASNVIDGDSKPLTDYQVVGAVMSGWVPGAYVYRHEKSRDDAKRAVAALFGSVSGSGGEVALLQERIDSDVIREVLGYVLDAMHKRPDMEQLVQMLTRDGANTLETLRTFAPLFAALVPDGETRRRAAAALEDSIMRGLPQQVALGRLGAKATARAILDAQFGKLLRYLGPLREEPRSLYPVAIGSDSEDVGVRGEYTASVLDLHKYTLVSYVAPDVFESQGANSKSAMTSLSVAVQDWLSYLGVVEKIETRDLARGLGHQVNVAPAGSPHEFRSLVHVGVGVSQVLPVLVMCLLAPPGSLLVLEQPELHLHPAVQSRLADFFMSQMLADKRFLIETHSEYLISRLRRRCVEADGDALSNRTTVYCAEPTGGEDGTAYREVAVNKFGGLTEWPKAFFDLLPSEASAIMAAAVRKRKLEKKED